MIKKNFNQLVVMAGHKMFVVNFLSSTYTYPEYFRFTRRINKLFVDYYYNFIFCLCPITQLRVYALHMFKFLRMDAFERYKPLLEQQILLESGQQTDILETISIDISFKEFTSVCTNYLLYNLCESHKFKKFLKIYKAHKQNQIISQIIQFSKSAELTSIRQLNHTKLINSCPLQQHNSSGNNNCEILKTLFVQLHEHLKTFDIYYIELDNIEWLEDQQNQLCLPEPQPQEEKKDDHENQQILLNQVPELEIFSKLTEHQMLSLENILEI